MKNTISNIYQKVGIKSERSKNITKHVFLAFFYKGGSIFFSFLLVPLTIDYLDTENYGIWLTLSSFIAWFSFFDIGLGNGLRNKFAEARAIGDMILARGYVSSAYFTIGTTSIVLIVIFNIVSYFIDWTKVFNTSQLLKNDLQLLMPIIFGFFCLQLVVKLITTIYTSDQNHSMQGKVVFYNNLGSLLIIWVMIKTSKSSLLVFGTIFSIFPVLILIGLNWLAFRSRYADIKPSLRFWQKKYLKDIFGLGAMFFIIQISGIILFTTDNFIISKLFSPAEVVPYNIAYKYISISSMLFSIIAAPYWSSITDAYKRLDYDWIESAMRNIRKISIIFILLILMMIIFSEYFYQMWIGSKVSINWSLTALMGLFFASTIYVTPYTMFLNGTGKVKLQAIQGAVAAIINIPLSIFLSHSIGLGVNGVILATVICFIPSIILNKVQYKKIVSNTANKFWNK